MHGSVRRRGIRSTGEDFLRGRSVRIRKNKGLNPAGFSPFIFDMGFKGSRALGFASQTCLGLGIAKRAWTLHSALTGSGEGNTRRGLGGGTQNSRNMRRREYAEGFLNTNGSN